MCPNCGDRKPPDIQYEFGEVDVEITDEELEAAGISKEECDGEHKEWICNYCDRTNNWGDLRCVGCDMPKSEATHEYGQTKIENSVKTTARNAKPASSVSSRGTGMTRAFVSPNILESNSQQRKRSGFDFGTIAIPLTIAFLLFLIMFAFWPIKEEVYVSGFEWERNIAIEELQTFKESGWSAPAGARVYDEKWEFRRYDQVIDHYETKQVRKSRTVQDGYTVSVSYRDNGNGTATRVENKTPKYKTEYYTETVKEPVYKKVEVWDTKYYYEIDRWVSVRESNASGTDKAPYWNTGYSLSDKERDTTKHESYEVLYDNGDTETLPFDEWMEVELGDGYVITKNRLGIIYSSKEVGANQRQ